MKISIITVCYNSESTIEKTIKSLINQSYKNIEYIVIDGNSTDSTVSIINNYLEYIDIFLSEKDFGLYDAINKGIKLATGELIGILHSDDIFFNNRVVEKIAQFHVENNIDASIGDIVQRNTNNTIIRKYSSKKWNPNKLIFGLMPPHPSIFIKKVLFEKYGGYSLEFRIAADFDLIVRFFYLNRINWKYSSIVTTNMLIGGLSSTGLNSYNILSTEIYTALSKNNVNSSQLLIRLRAIWKLFEFIRR